MAKIVYSACYGGFGLSEEAIYRYAEIKGLKLYPETEHGLTTYWTVPKEERAGILEGDAWYRATQEECIKSNQLHSKITLYDKDIPRHDPALAQVVEEMGDAASGRFANLRIEEIPSGSPYRIEEYDGFESIARPETDQWEIAP